MEKCILQCREAFKNKEWIIKRDGEGVRLCIDFCNKKKFLNHTFNSKYRSLLQLSCAPISCLRSRLELLRANPILELIEHNPILYFTLISITFLFLCVIFGMHNLRLVSLKEALTHFKMYF